MESKNFSLSITGPTSSFCYFRISLNQNAQKTFLLQEVVHGNSEVNKKPSAAKSPPVVRLAPRLPCKPTTTVGHDIFARILFSRITSFGL